MIGQGWTRLPGAASDFRGGLWTLCLQGFELETDRGAAVDSRVDLQKTLGEKVKGGSHRAEEAMSAQAPSGGEGRADYCRRRRMLQQGHVEKTQAWTELHSASQLPRLCDSWPYFLIAPRIPTVDSFLKRTCVQNLHFCSCLTEFNTGTIAVLRKSPISW